MRIRILSSAAGLGLPAGLAQAERGMARAGLLAGSIPSRRQTAARPEPAAPAER